MSILLAISLGLNIGFILSKIFKHTEDCPRRILGYNCRGDRCDHSKSLLYANMSAMAQNDEGRA